MSDFWRVFLILFIVGFSAYIVVVFALGWPFWVGLLVGFAVQTVVGFLIPSRPAPLLKMHEGTWYDEVDESADKK